MQRIGTLLQKINELYKREGFKSLVDADLMLDYIRVLYADTMEWRDELSARQTIAPTNEPTLDELAAAYEAGNFDEEEEPDTEEIAKAALAAREQPRPVAHMAPPPAPTIAPAPPPVSEPDYPPPAAQTFTPPKPPVPTAEHTATPKPHQPAPQQSSLRFEQTLGINDRLLFLNELFGGNGERFASALSAINDATSLHEARMWLGHQAGIQENEEDLNTGLFFGLLRCFYQQRHSK